MRNKGKGKHRVVLQEKCQGSVTVTHKAVGKSNPLYICMRTYETDIPRSAILKYLYISWGHAVAQLVQTLLYKPEFFVEHNPSGRNMALGWTQHLTEMSKRNISWG